jgi:hypothetical protein
MFRYSLDAITLFKCEHYTGGNPEIDSDFENIVSCEWIIIDNGKSEDLTFN